jgi:hypothetical protein
MQASVIVCYKLAPLMYPPLVQTLYNDRTRDSIPLVEAPWCLLSLGFRASPRRGEGCEGFRMGLLGVHRGLAVPILAVERRNRNIAYAVVEAQAGIWKTPKCVDTAGPFSMGRAGTCPACPKRRRERRRGGGASRGDTADALRICVGLIKEALTTLSVPREALWLSYSLVGKTPPPFPPSPVKGAVLSRAAFAVLSKQAGGWGSPTSR